MVNDYKISVDVTKASALLLKMRKRAVNLQMVFEGPIANRLHELFAKIFATSGAYIGSPWAPLMPSTIASKARVHRANMGILRKYNTLWGSLVKRGSPLGYQIATATSLSVGTNVPYAADHQEGTARMPARVIVPEGDAIPQQEVDAWADLIIKHLEAA